jgi:uncharacterized membrane protein YGL010W
LPIAYFGLRIVRAESVIDNKVSNQQSEIGNQSTTVSNDFFSNYKAKHQHRLNRLTHSFGIPLIVISLPIFFLNWRWALTLFIAGWILQFVGHAIEGNQPAFFRNPVYILVGPFWFVRRAASALRLVKPHVSK